MVLLTLPCARYFINGALFLTGELAVTTDTTEFRKRLS